MSKNKAMKMDKEEDEKRKQFSDTNVCGMIEKKHRTNPIWERTKEIKMKTNARVYHKNMYKPILSDEVAPLVQEDLKGEEEELRLCIAVEECNNKLFNHEQVSFVYRGEDGTILVATSPEIKILEQISQTKYLYAATFAKLLLERYWTIVKHDVEVLKEAPH